MRHKDGNYLFMQRDKRKHQSGKWEATAGGSAVQGEKLCCKIRFCGHKCILVRIILKPYSYLKS